MLGRLPRDDRGEGAGDRESSSSGGDGRTGRGYWVFVGLGARGLVYHAWLAQLLAAAVVADDESLLPPELREWQQWGDRR